MRHQRIAHLALFALCTLGGSAVATPLTGSGTHLPIPSPNPGMPAFQSPTISTVSGGFTGTWASPALSAWLGTFSATGPLPVAPNFGTTNYDFTPLAATAVLPVGTYFFLGDVDIGSGTGEIFDMRAYDSSGALLSAWLDEPVAVWGPGSGSGGAIDVRDMPSWSYNTISKTYRFDGGTTGPFPFVSTLTIAMLSNQPIARLELVKLTTLNYSFGLGAPVPAPGTLPILSGAGLIAWRRRHRAVSSSPCRALSLENLCLSSRRSR